MRYRNTKTGMESDQFSEADWKTGVPQRKGWVKNDERPVKTMPKDLVDFVFKKKPVVIEPITEETGVLSLDGIKVTELDPKEFKEPDLTPNVLKEKFSEAGAKAAIKKQSKTKKDDNPKQKRRTSKRNA